MSAPVSQVIAGVTAPLTTVATYAGNQWSPIEVPEPTAIFDAVRKGWVSPELAGEVLLCHGILFQETDEAIGVVDAGDAKALNNVWHKTYVAGHTTPSDSDAIDYLLRHPDRVTQVDEMLHRNGWIDPAYKSVMIELANVIPGSSQLTAYVSQNLFSPEFVQAWGLDDGYPKSIEQWQSANGIVWDTGLQGYG